VFSVDTLPDRPRLLVANTDPSNEPGRHWVCIRIEGGRGEFFDSFGRRPNALFERYLNRHCWLWTYNDIDRYRVLRVNFVGIIAFAFFVVVASKCVTL